MSGRSTLLNLFLLFMLLVIGLTAIASYITHYVVCIGEEAWGFLIAGALIPPVAIIHGVGSWFGVW